MSRLRRTARIMGAVAALAVACSGTVALAGESEGEGGGGGAAAAGTLCGAAVLPEDDESWQAAFDRSDARYGGLEVFRDYHGGVPRAWPGRVDTGGRPLSVSFKADPVDVVENANGTLDALRAWFASAPTDQDVYWTYYHEPEDNIANGEFTAAEYRQAWAVLADAAAEAGNPRLHATLILMEWSLQPGSGRDWRDYYPGSDVVDVLGWDVYNDIRPDPDGYRSPADMFGEIVAVSEQEELPFAVAELGSGLAAGDDGTQRAGWLRDLTSYLTEHGALFAVYFDLDWRSSDQADFRLTDEPSRAAWSDFCDA